jgi:hypothetical protein
MARQGNFLVKKIILKRERLLGNKKKQLPLTKGFVQLGHDVEAIIGSAYPSFGFGGRNSVGQ